MVRIEVRDVAKAASRSAQRTVARAIYMARTWDELETKLTHALLQELTYVAGQEVRDS